MLVADIALFIDQVERWSIVVTVSPPGLAIIVLRDRVGDLQAFYGLGQVFQIGFVFEFWVMIANDYQSLRRIFFMPAPQRGDHIDTIYSKKSPHL